MKLELEPIEGEKILTEEEKERLKRRTRPIPPDALAQFSDDEKNQIKHFLVKLILLSEHVDHDMKHEDQFDDFDTHMLSLNQARQAIFRVEDKKITAPEPVAVDSGRSRGELSFLKAAGADNVDKDIRTVVDREADSLQGDETFLQSLVFWREPDKPGTIVDADGEARRLRENAALGKPATAGETPTIERRKKALFEDLF